MTDAFEVGSPDDFSCSEGPTVWNIGYCIHIFFKHSDHPHLINVYVYVGGKSWSILTYVPCFFSWLLQTTLMACIWLQGQPTLVLTRDILKI